MVSPQFKPILGGYERAAERLSAALARRGQQVTVVTERRQSDWPRRERCDGFEIIRLPCSYRRGLHGVSAVLSFLWFLIINGRRYDLFHIHQYGDYVLAAWLAGRMLNKPIVLKVTNTDADGIGSIIGSSKSMLANMLNAAHRKVSACVAPSRAAVSEAIEFGIQADRVHLIPNGLDVEYYSPCSIEDKQQLKRQLSISAERVVLYVGRLSEEKNPLGLLRAWSGISGTLGSALLVFVGTGPQFDEVKALADMPGCAGSVRLVGNSDDVRAWYRIADIFALPSNNEGLSNSLLEAMACGLPVVSTRVSGSEEIFSDADIGELVEVGDTPGLAKALAAMLADAARRQHCGKIARDYAAREFSINNIADKILKLYEQLVV